MTRNEAIQDIIDHRMWWHEIDEYVITTNDAIDTIYQIFNDQESRVCENCKYFLTKPTGYERCEKLETEVGFYFGCNWFERGKDG